MLHVISRRILPPAIMEYEYIHLWLWPGLAMHLASRFRSIGLPNLLHHIGLAFSWGSAGWAEPFEFAAAQPRAGVLNECMC